MPSSASAADETEFAATAVSDVEFAGLMDRLGGFEPGPLLAVGVSGGADSLALIRLADRWARGAGGRAIGLIVDHGLRAESAAEAALVAARLDLAGIERHVLRWDGPYPLHGLPAAARAARYRLLGEWCREAGVLHLAIAHHRDDQAETLIMRLGRGSGLSGLAGMAPIVETAHHRLLRPLLGIPAARLRATLRLMGEAWLEDPSNRNPVWLRARIRHAGDAWTRLGLDASRLAATADHLGRARRVVEDLVDRLLARTALVHPAGFVALDRRVWSGAPAEIRLRALAAAIRTVGGATQAPRFERLERLDRGLREAGDPLPGRTLGGCRVEASGNRILILREPGAIGPRLAVPAHGEVVWDGRFLVTSAGSEGVEVGALGAAGMRSIRTIASPIWGHHLASSARLALPAFWREDSLVGVPHLGWRRAGSPGLIGIRFRPSRPLSGSGFTEV